MTIPCQFDLFVCLIGVLRRFQHYFSYITATVHFIHGSLGKQTSTRQGNVLCPRALHHDRRAATWYQTRDANHTTKADSSCQFEENV